MSQRPAWMDMKGPSGYIAGSLRGDMGFTTRSDLGSAGSEPVQGAAGANAGGRAKTHGPLPTRSGTETGDTEDGKDARDADGATYNSEFGYQTNLFKGVKWDANDDEADAIYAQVDARMDARRLEKRKAREEEELKLLEKRYPRVQDQFLREKSELANVSAAEWNAIPEAAELTHAKKTRFAKPSHSRQETITAIPASVIESTRLAHISTSTYLDPEAALGPASGTGTAAIDFLKGTDLQAELGTATSKAKLTMIGDARNTLMRVKLDQASSDSKTGQTVIDPNGYLTGLQTQANARGTMEVGDVEQARLLLKKLTSTNPAHGPGWIALARLEQAAGKLAAARQIILIGAEKCPMNEDVWIEAVRLQANTKSSEDAKAVITQALASMPQSVRLWLEAASLETEDRHKKRILRKAIESIPNSVRLWKTAIDMEADPENALLLMNSAVECCPEDIDLWLALAYSETFERARSVLNRARKHLPFEKKIWIAAAKLEEQALLSQPNRNTSTSSTDHSDPKSLANTKDADDNDDIVQRTRQIIGRAIKTLQTNGVSIVRDEWLKAAEGCDQAGSVYTCNAIIRAVADLDIDQVDLEQTLMGDAVTSVANQSIGVARAIYQYAAERFSQSKLVWANFAFFEKQHGGFKKLIQTLRQAVKHRPDIEMLWLMMAKETWIQGDERGARAILNQAFDLNPNSEQIWLAAIKLESETNQYTRAIELMQKALSQTKTPRMYLKSALLYWQLASMSTINSNEKKDCNLIQNTAPTGTILDSVDAKTLMNKAIDLLNHAVVNFPKYPKFWMMLGQIYEHMEDYAAAARTYRQATTQFPTSDTLWVLQAKLEAAHGSVISARSIFEKARVHNPNSEKIWLAFIRFEKQYGSLAQAKALVSRAIQSFTSSGLLYAESLYLEDPVTRRTKALTAISKLESDPYLLIAIARMFWQEKKIAKAREWFKKATASTTTIGDPFIELYAFELGQGDSEQQKAVVDAFLSISPKHGDLWAPIHKNVRHWRCKPEDVFLIAAKTIKSPLSS